MNNISNFQLPIIVGISGASGTIYGLRLIQFLLENNYNVNLVFSNSAYKVAKEELGLELANSEKLNEQVLAFLSLSKEIKNLKVFQHDDIAASISSGSYKTQGMIIMPCSMGTISAIRNGASTNLLTRASDVCIKERRKLILIPREMPYSTIHLENMYELSKLGVIIAPACPGFYNKPQCLTDSIDFVVGKVLDLFNIENNLFNRWKSNSEPLPILK